MPTDTASMKYNYDKHKYVLDVAAFATLTGHDFVALEGSLTKATDKMYQISRTIYNFIYKHTHYRDSMEYWLATESSLRPAIQEALEEQARYEAQMSPEYLKLQNGVNFLNGMQIPLERFRGEIVIAPDAYQILLSSKLLYAGQRYRIEMHDYTTDNY